jgi:hypothetical protein
VDRYRDFWFDTKADDYGRLLLHFDPLSAQSPGATTPLLDAILQEPDDNARAIVVHWQDPAAPDQPGQIVVLHGVKRYPLSPGGTSTPWDNKIFAWYQDVVAASAPTLLTIPDGNIFTIAQPTNGATIYRVYKAATLAALYAADPQLIIAPTPGAGAAGTEVIQTRYAFSVPF